MALNFNPRALPGPGTAVTSDTRVVVLADAEYLVRGVIVDGSLSRDPLNTGDVDYLRAGMVLGRITATSLYAPSILGVSTVAYSNTGSTNTNLYVSAYTATEIVRRIGTSGTFKLTGPPSAAGTVAVSTVTYSAVNTTSGLITVTAIGANKIAGAWVQPTDGSETMKCLIGNGSPLRVTDADDSDIDVELSNPVIGGQIDSSQIINYPSDTSMITYIEDALQECGRFVFDAKFI